MSLFAAGVLFTFTIYKSSYDYWFITRYFACYIMGPYCIFILSINNINVPEYKVLTDKSQSFFFLDVYLPQNGKQAEYEGNSAFRQRNVNNLHSNIFHLCEL